MAAGRRPNQAERPHTAWDALLKADIEALLGTRPVAKTEHFVLHCLLPAMVVRELSTDVAPDRDRSVDKTQATPQAAAARGLATLVPKRHAKRAVTRNLIRRQMRDVLRVDDTVPPACKLLIRLRGPFDGRRYPAAASPALRIAVREELVSLLGQRRATRWQ
jgi:ribonuclease P protein component